MLAVTKAKHQRCVWPDDTFERVQAALLERKKMREIAEEFGVSVMTMGVKVRSMGFKNPRKPNRFTPEDDAVLRADWIAMVDLNETAVKLGRSFGTCRQRLLNAHKDILKGERTSRVSQAVKQFGVGILANGQTMDEAVTRARKIIIQAKADARVRAIQAKAAFQDRLLTEMKHQIDGGKDRNEAIFECRAGGVSLERIGQHFGVTRERIRQICDETAYRLASASVLDAS